MTHMPKHMTKGPYFERMGVQHSPPPGNATNRTERIRVLKALRNNTDLAEIGSVNDVGRQPGKAHVKSDWFGNPNQPGSTGWWRSWRGEPQNVLRCGLIQALEVSMGLPHHCPQHGAAGEGPAVANPSNSTDRNLPIDYYWVCGPSRFEVYVNWNPRQVTVIIVTPGFNFPLVESPQDPAATLDNWAAKNMGTIFVGQAEDRTDPDPDGPYDFTTMAAGVVSHHLAEVNGGSGSW